MTLTLVKFPSNSHDTSIALKDDELILHAKAPACKIANMNKTSHQIIHIHTSIHTIA